MSKELANSVVHFLGNLALGGQVLAALLILLLVSTRISKNTNLKKIAKTISLNSMSLAFLVALIATLGSLFLSEIAHFTPCKLCWFQRIFMYPQALILGIAIYKNDFSIKKYIIGLSTVGLLIAIYHYVLQMAPIPLPCTDEIASCAAKQFAQYGFITIPLMSSTAFALILLFMFLSRKK